MIPYTGTFGKTRMVRIPTKIFQHMVSHAVREAPLECCGILVGKGRTAIRVYEVPNADRSAVSFSMPPEEQFRVFHEIETEHLDMVGIYHSHPYANPFPSKRDVEFALYIDVAYIIVSLQGGRTSVKGFRIGKEGISVEPIRVLG
jgi:proteasome lid subunit RPN8/RPN11